MRILSVQNSGSIPLISKSFQAMARLCDLRTIIRAVFSSTLKSFAIMTDNLLSPSKNAYSRWEEDKQSLLLLRRVRLKLTFNFSLPFFGIEDDPTSPKVYQPYLDPEGDILLLETFLNNDPSLSPPNQGNYLPEVRKKLKICEAKYEKSSVDEPPEVELEDLPSHLEYAFLEGDNKLLKVMASLPTRRVNSPSNTSIIALLILKNDLLRIKESLFQTKNGIRLMLAPRLSKAKHSAIPGKSHGIKHLPGSPNFLGNFLRRTTEKCSFNGVWAISLNFSLFLIKALRVESNYRLRDWRSNGLRSEDWLFRLDNLRVKNPLLKNLMFEESELGKLEVGKPGVDKQERKENQEVEFDLTSSEDDS
nr:reverse transcriptase domain-containing protein [Tanacetum cinerariifolium]